MADDGSDSCTGIANMNCLCSGHAWLTRTEVDSLVLALADDGRDSCTYVANMRCMFSGHVCRT
jgi:hypothetical protein